MCALLFILLLFDAKCFVLLSLVIKMERQAKQLASPYEIYENVTLDISDIP